MNQGPGITGVSLLSVYAVDYEASFRFYHDVLGLTTWSAMGPNAAYFRFGAAPDGEPFGMYLVGGRSPGPTGPKVARTTFAFDVPSVGAVLRHLRAHGVQLLQEEPMDMGTGAFWLQALDPSGNVVEFLGGA